MTNNPLVIFALDSADPGLMKQYMMDGAMPNLKRLAVQGSQGPIKDENTLIELGIYNIIFSGESREETGYYDFRQLVPGTYKLRHHVDGTDFGRDPFWCELQQTPHKTLVLDVFDARLVPDLPGTQISNWGVNNMKRPMAAFPTAMIPVVEARGKRIFANQQMPASFRHSQKIYKNMMVRLDRKLELISDLIKEQEYSLLVLGFGEVHGATHQFWRYRPEHAANDPNWQPTALEDAIRTIYQKTDESIGRILQQLPPDANTFVITHCGFKDQFPVENLMTNLCIALGYQTPKVLPIRDKLHPANVLRRITPLAWRIAISRKFLTTAQRDDILGKRFEHGLDWDNTTLFDMSSLFTGFLRVNLRGREPQGIIAPGEEYDGFLNKVENDLMALKDKRSGRPLLKHIVKSKGTYTVDEPISLPDIVAIFHEFPYFIDEVTHPNGSIKQQRNLFFRESTHDDEGFFIAAGPQIQGGETLSDVPPNAFAPTFLTLLGRSVPDFMRGETLKILR